MGNDSSAIYCTVYELSHHQWEPIGETEKVENPTDIDFEKLIKAKFTFNTLQRLKFVVTDGAIDGGEIGSVETTMGDLVMAQDYFKAKLKDSTTGNAGDLIVTLSEALEVGDGD